MFTLKLVAALGCGLMAGVFFAFSTFVMSALARLQPAQGIAAMQSINITVYNPWFMTAFLGTGAACIFLAVSSLFKRHQPGAAYHPQRNHATLMREAHWRDNRFTNSEAFQLPRESDPPAL